MSASLTLPAPGPRPSDLIAAHAPTAGSFSAATKAKAKTAAQNFEAVFINTMFQQMYTDVDGDGPFGGSGATGIWRSMLTDEYAKTFSKSGGIGIADQVYKSLLAQQEIKQ